MTACGSGSAEAISAFREILHAERYPDLVITDIRMPDRNGYEVFEACEILNRRFLSC